MNIEARIPPSVAALFSQGDLAHGADLAKSEVLEGGRVDEIDGADALRKEVENADCYESAVEAVNLVVCWGLLVL